jgi:hypothetical protein
LAKKTKRKSSKEPVRYDTPFEIEEEDYEKSPPRTVSSLVMAYILDQNEVNSLIEASEAPYVDAPVDPTFVTQTYSEEEVAALMDCNYKPRRYKKKK